MTVNVKNDPNYYGDQYLKLPFSVDFWGTRGFLPQVGLGMLPPPCPYNETHWPPKSGEGADYISLYNQALKETDPTKRCDIVHEMQKAEYDVGPSPRRTMKRTLPFSKSVFLMFRRTLFAKRIVRTPRSAILLSLAMLPALPKSL